MCNEDTGCGTAADTRQSVLYWGGQDGETDPASVCRPADLSTALGAHIIPLVSTGGYEGR